MLDDVEHLHRLVQRPGLSVLVDDQVDVAVQRNYKIHFVAAMPAARRSKLYRNRRRIIRWLQDNDQNRASNSKSRK